MKSLPIKSAVPIPPAARMELARQLDARLKQLPDEVAELILDCTPERLQVLQRDAIREREHIRYAQAFLEILP